MDFIFALKDGSHCEIAFSCGHPDIENNQCPTRFGDCENCRHGVARMQIKDAMRLLDIGRGGENEWENCGICGHMTEIPMPAQCGHCGRSSSN